MRKGAKEAVFSLTGLAPAWLSTPALMAYIRHIPPSRAGGRLAHVYREIRNEVPRVPNLMQVFSLRPETMEGIYRSWLSCMWNGRLPRQTKELLAVAVSQAAHCRYCADAHMVFLQAAGMDHTKAFEIERLLGQSKSLSHELRVAVEYAQKITTDPRALSAADKAQLAAAWPQLDLRVELVAVIASFNGIARVANALGVSLEIPVALRRFEAGRRGAITLLSRLTAMSVDMGEKTVPARTPEENKAGLEHLFLSHLGFPACPPGFDNLQLCPDLFDGQLRLIEKAVAVLPRDRWMFLGLVVGRLSGCDYLSANCGDWLSKRSVSAATVIAASEGGGSSLSDAEECCLRFARDLTLHSHTIGEERIRELRKVGLSDGAILDLAFVAGIFNGMSRFVLSLGDEEQVSH